jgi:cobalt-zinc-cadmium efflux system membrane fusion protein
MLAFEPTALMTNRVVKITFVVIGVLSLATANGCSKANDEAAEAPPAASVVSDFDVGSFTVDHPEQFPLATVTSQSGSSQLVVTGTVAPDVSRTVPVISLASGRVVEIRARLGDTVKKGQLLMRVRSNDISTAFSDYRKAVTDEVLSRTQLERSKGLYEHGAIALNDLQIAQDTEDKAKVDIETSSEHIRLLGSVLDHPSGIVDIVAPISGVITDQQVTNAAGVQGLGTNSFTISDISYVWIVCDVYENDVPNVRVGDTADIRLSAYPDKVLKGAISNIGAGLDPSIRTAKVRIEVKNPGLMRLGMFVTATFQSKKKETYASVPASAILHMHDRDWVYLPEPDKKFRRIEVTSGEALLNGMQEIKSGIQPGQQVIANALTLEHTIER